MELKKNSFLIGFLAIILQIILLIVLRDYNLFAITMLSTTPILLGATIGYLHKELIEIFKGCIGYSLFLWFTLITGMLITDSTMILGFIESMYGIATIPLLIIGSIIVAILFAGLMFIPALIGFVIIQAIKK